MITLLVTVTILAIDISLALSVLDDIGVVCVSLLWRIFPLVVALLLITMFMVIYAIGNKHKE